MLSMSAPIFISYSSRDRNTALTICQALENRGLSCWISCRDIGPGENFQVSIVHAIRAAKVMVVVFSANANNSEQIKKELVLAGQSQLVVIPVRVEDITPDEAFAYELATRQWIDLFLDWEGAIERLVGQLAAMGDVASGSPTEPLRNAGAGLDTSASAPSESGTGSLQPRRDKSTLVRTVLAEAESLLIGAVSEAAQHPANPARQRRRLRFWRETPDAPSRDISRSESTAIIPFPGLRFAESTVLRTGTTDGSNRPAQRPHQSSAGTSAEIKPLQPRDRRIGRAPRLSLLAGLTILPVLISQAWLELDLRSDRQAAIRESVVHRVRQLAADIGELREGARQLLLAISQMEAVRLRQPEACPGLLARLKSRYPNYVLLAAADLQGRIFCASGPAPASVEDQSFFARAMAHDGLAVGNYWVSPADGQKMISFALQITDGNGSPAGVVFAGLDLAWLSDHLKESGLPPTSSTLIADRDGNIIARLPSPPDFVGNNMRATHERIMDGGEAGWEEVTGVDGVTRIFGYVPASLPPKDFFLSIGEQKDALLAAINAATWRDTAVLLVGLLGSICAAWAGAQSRLRSHRRIPPTRGSAPSIAPVKTQ
jgi:hypothetical protein